MNLHAFENWLPQSHSKFCRIQCSLIALNQTFHVELKHQLCRLIGTYRCMLWSGWSLKPHGFYVPMVFVLDKTLTGNTERGKMSCTQALASSSGSSPNYPSTTTTSPSNHGSICGAESHDSAELLSNHNNSSVDMSSATSSSDGHLLSTSLSTKCAVCNETFNSPKVKYFDHEFFVFYDTVNLVDVIKGACSVLVQILWNGILYLGD